MSRANPFGDLDDFAPQGGAKPVPAAAIDEIAEASGFPSRKAAAKAAPAAKKASVPNASRPTPENTQIPTNTGRQPRRRTTGRNQQINIKATEETIARLYSIADELDLPLGAVLERALEALAGKSSS